jgi:hypothetical protein
MNTAHLLAFAWILTISARIWTPWNSLHRLTLRLTNLCRRACLLLYLSCKIISRDFTKQMRQTTVNLMFFHPSVRLSVWIELTSATRTEMISMKAHLYWNLSTHSDFGENWTKITGTLHIDPRIYIYNYNFTPRLVFLIEICYVLCEIKIYVLDVTFGNIL